MGITGTTGTGLDRAIDLIANDYALNIRLSGAAIREGAAAADAMNGLIVSAIRSLGLANDGEITTPDMHSINSTLRTTGLARFTTLYGTDKDRVETGFQHVAGEGAVTRLIADAGVDRVLSSLYSLAVEIKDGHVTSPQNHCGAADVNGDRVADFAILIAGSTTFIAADFVLRQRNGSYRAGRISREARWRAP